MRGFCKCDLCGRHYHEDENEMYDGITVWWKGKPGQICFPDDKKLLTTPDGKYITDIPGRIDVCPECQERFFNWIKMARNEAKGLKDDDFPMNKPE